MPKQVVVIGAGQGGLSAAIYARLRGYEVLVLEQRRQVGGKAAQIDVDGFRFDPGPSIIILPQIYEAVFRDAGRPMDRYLRFRRLDPIARVRYEGRFPIDLPADADECVRVLSSVAPEDGASLRKLVQILDRARPHVEQSIFDHPYHNPFQLLDPHLAAMGAAFDVRLTYKELVDRWFQSPLLRAFFYGFPSYGGQTYDGKAPGALMIPFLMIRDGVFYPEGGVGAIPRAFETLAREIGVQFRFGCRVTGVQTKGKVVRSILLEGGRHVEADIVISNRDRLATREWLGESVDWPPSLSYFTIQWGLRAKTPGLSHHTLCIPTGFERAFEQLYRCRSFPEEPIVYLNETSDADSASTPRGKTNLFAVVTSPARMPSIDWKGQSGEFRRRTLEVMRRCGVPIDPNRSELEYVQTPDLFEERDGSYKGSLYGPDEAHRLFKLFPMRVIDERYRNLYYCGGSVQPGAGLPMVTLSGKFAASLLE